MLEMAGKSAALERWLADNEKKAVTGTPCLSTQTLHSPCRPLPCTTLHPCAHPGLGHNSRPQKNGSTWSARAWPENLKAVPLLRELNRSAVFLSSTA